MGEWTIMRKSIKRMCSSVIALQRMIRRFFGNKSRRCESMHREWQRIEDKYLQEYFKLYAFKCVEDRALRQMEGADTSYATPDGRRHLRTQTVKMQSMQLKMTRDDTNSMVESGLDWKGLRIPSQLRKNVISRYYMVELSKHIRLQDAMKATIRSSVQNQRDMTQLMNFFGVDHHHHDMELPSFELVMPEFWHLKEDCVISMMCMAAESLQKSKESFKEHPGNKSSKLPEVEFDKFCRHHRNLSHEVELAIAAELESRTLSRASLVRSGELHELNRLIARHSIVNQAPPDLSSLKGGTSSPGAKAGEKERSVTFVGEEGPRAALNLDDLWQAVSPRLQDIVEEQSAEWRDRTQEHDERLDNINQLDFNVWCSESPSGAARKTPESESQSVPTRRRTD